MTDVSGRAARRAALLAVLVAGVAGGALGACTEVGTDPDEAVSLAFDSLPAPSVVVGDTMRDETGAATPLTAHAFNADNDEIPGAPVQFVYLPADTTQPIRTAITISDAFIIASPTAPTTGTYRVVAQSGALQSQPAYTFAVVPRPDEVQRVAPANGEDTITYFAIDSTRILRVKVLHDTVDGPTVPVPSYPVRFELDTAPAGAAPVGFVVGRDRVDSLVTPTDAQGEARVTVVVVPGAGPLVADSVIVKAYVEYLPKLVRNSPVRLVVRVVPPAAAP